MAVKIKLHPVSLTGKWTVNFSHLHCLATVLSAEADEVVLTTWCRSLCDDGRWAYQHWQTLAIDIQV